MIRKSSISELRDAPNITALLDEYAAESANDTMPRPNARAEAYLSLEGTGMLHTFLAEKNSNIIGFITLLVTVMPHYGVPMAVTESFFVQKNHRKSGAGNRLLVSAEEYAESVGAYGVLISAPYSGVLNKVLSKSSKYTPSNIVYFRRLSHGK